jgi:hypothetical protein
MQCFGFSLPLIMSTLVAYIILFFTQGFTKETISIGHFFYLDKPQGMKKDFRGKENDCFGFIFSTWIKTFDYFFNWIFDSLVIKNENNKSCLVSNI